MPFMNNIKELCLVPGKASGDIASFEAAAAPLVSCICTINPVQSGSGDPSPSNIRPITGHDDVTITQKDGNNTVVDTTTITFPDTIYGASLDVGTGVLTIDRAIVDMGSLNWTSFYQKMVYMSFPLTPAPSSASTKANLICSNYKTVSRNEIGQPPWNYAGIGVDTNGNLFVADPNSSWTSIEEAKTSLSGAYLCYELATPTTTQLTPEQLNSILGDNNFYHDGNGPIDITYIRRYQT